jgi:esterase/lipase
MTAEAAVEVAVRQILAVAAAVAAAAGAAAAEIFLSFSTENHNLRERKLKKSVAKATKMAAPPMMMMALKKAFQRTTMKIAQAKEVLIMTWTM